MVLVYVALRAIYLGEIPSIPWLGQDYDIWLGAVMMTL
jgi:hypothetical protein